MISPILLASLALASLPLAFAAPASDSNLRKRDGTCTLTAMYQLGIVIGSGGPGQAPVSNTNTYFFMQTPANQTGFEVPGDSIDNSYQTLPSSETQTAQNVGFGNEFNLSGYDSCFVSYLGVQTNGVTGVPSGDPCDQAGWTCAQCVVTFQC